MSKRQFKKKSINTRSITLASILLIILSLSAAGANAAGFTFIEAVQELVGTTGNLESVMEKVFKPQSAVQKNNLTAAAQPMMMPPLTAVQMSSQPNLSYTENFNDIANWTNNFASGTGTDPFSAVATGTGTIPNATAVTVSSATFQTTGSSGGIQRGTLQSPQTTSIVLLSSGTTDNTNSTAFDFLMNFTGVNAGNLSFDWASINNAAGDRKGSLRVYWSTNGTTFTELTAAQVLNFTNNSPTSGSITNVALPTAFNNSATARLRFYNHNAAGGTTGSRPKISIDNLKVTATAIATPTITLTGGPLTFANTNVGETSAGQSLTVSGSNLTANIVCTAPTDFEVSTTSGSGFGSTATFTPTSGTASGTLYARFKPATVGNKTGNISCASTGATTQNVAVSGTATVPTINTTVTTLNAFANTNVGATSAEQSLTVSGTDLTSNISCAAPTDFEVSTTSGTNFGTSATFTPTSGTASGTLFVRFKPTTAGGKSGSVTCSSTGAADKTVAVSGTGVATLSTSVNTLPAFASTNIGETSASQSLTVSGTGLTANVSCTAPTHFEVSNGSGFGTSAAFTPTGGSVNGTLSVRFKPTAAGNLSGNVTCTSGTLSQNVAVSGTGVQTYTLTYTANANGSIQGTSPQTVAANGSGTAVTAVPNANYRFVNWDDNSTANPRTDTNVTANVSVTANFALNEYTLTTNAQNGSVSVSPAANGSGGKYLHGTQVTLTATPNAGYRFTGWSEPTCTGIGTCSVTMDQNRTITANFVAEEYTLTIVSENGTVTKSPDKATYNYNDVVTLTATPNEGYDFTGFTPASPVTIQGNTTVTANYAIKTYTISTNAGANGSISPTTATVNHGGSQTFSITPNAGYSIETLTVGGQSQTPSATYTFNNVTSNRSIAATFKANNITFGQSGDLPSGSYLNVNVASGSVVTLTGNVEIVGTLTIENGGTLVLGSSVITGAGSFVLADGATLSIGSADGISAAPNQTGNVQTQNRTFSQLANYVYAGGGNQSVGNGLPATVANLTIANTGFAPANLVTGNDGQLVSGLLRIASGSYESHSDYNDVTIDAGANLTLSGNVTVSGNWTNNGSFNANGFGVTFDGVSGQTISGNSTFYNFTKNVSTAQTLNFAAGSTTTVTNSLSLNGAAGQLLSLRSTTDGSLWNLVAPVSTTATFVDVKDSNNSGSSITAANSVNSFNNTGWSFPANTFTVQYAVGTGGTIQGNTTQTVEQGTDGTEVTALANTGYRFVKWNDNNTNPTRRETNVQSNLSFTAEFAINTFTVSYDGNGNTSGTAPTGGTFDYNSTVTVANAGTLQKTGYAFAGWNTASNGSGVSYQSGATFAANANVTLFAQWNINSYTITASAGSNGSISPTGTQTALYGESLSFTISADTGYRIADVLVDGVSVGAVSSYTFTSIDANHTISASFAIKTYTITSSAGSGGSISPSGTVSADHGSSKTFSITPIVGYSISDVKVNGISVGAVSSYTISNVTADQTIAAAFVINKYTITASATGGSITPSGAVEVNHGASQSFSFTPNPGFNLSSLKIDGVSVPLPSGDYTFTNVTSNHTIEAQFSGCIAVSTPVLTSPTGVSVSIPVNTSDLTGKDVIAAQFKFEYDPAVLSSLASDISVTPGSVLPTGSNAPTIDINPITPGTLLVSIYGSQAFTGAGNLVNVNMKVIGAAGLSTPLTLSDFLYNGGYTCTDVTSGTLTVISTDTMTTVTSSQNPSVYGTSVTFTATVSPIPTGGTVDFVIDGTPVATNLPLNASGQAVYSTNSLTVAGSPHSVSATYSGFAPAYTGSTGTLSPGQTVTQANQTISVTTPAPATAEYASTFAVAATSSSGLPVSITASGACSGSGVSTLLVTMTSGTGICTITYSQAGNSNYFPAPNQTSETQAQKRPATWTTQPASKLFGAFDPEPLTTGSGLGFLETDGVTATYTREGGEAVSPPTYRITATLSSTMNALGNYDITNNGAEFTILKANQTITVTTEPPANAQYGNSFTVAATASSNLPVAITASGTCSGSGTSSASITMTSGSGVCTILFNQAGDGSYNAAPEVSRTVNAQKRPATWTTNNASKLFGDNDPNPLTTGSGSGFLTADGVTATYTREAGEAVSPPTYRITATLASTTNALGNYDITNNGAEFTIFARSLTGRVTYKNAANPIVPVARTTISAAGSTPVPASVLNGLDGYYSISGFGTGSYTISASKADESCLVPRGIFADDASLISKHVVRLITLNGNQIEAGKVSGLAQLTSFDAALVAQYVVCIGNPINQTGKWRFTPANIFISTTVQDFEGILKGDVNGSWLAETSRPAYNPIAENAAEAVKVSVPKVGSAQGTTVALPLKLENLAGQSVDSYQFDIAYDPTVVEPLANPVIISETKADGLSVVSNVPRPGLLKVAVYGAVAANGDGVYANLKFAVTGSPGTSSKLAIRSFRFNGGEAQVSIFDGAVSVLESNQANLKGRVISANGEPLAGARVVLSATNGGRVFAVTNSFGNFEFSGLTLGETYNVDVKAKHYTFQTRTFSVSSNATELEIASDN